LGRFVPLAPAVVFYTFRRDTPNEAVVKVDQLPNDVIFAEKFLHDNVRSLVFAAVFALFTLFGTPDRSSALMPALAGAMLLIEARCLHVSAMFFAHLDQPKPAWLDAVRILALLSGLGILATGIWFFVRR
jgi:hypothetical protein